MTTRDLTAAQRDTLVTLLARGQTRVRDIFAECEDLTGGILTVAFSTSPRVANSLAALGLAEVVRGESKMDAHVVHLTRDGREVAGQIVEAYERMLSAVGSMKVGKVAVGVER